MESWQKLGSFISRNMIVVVPLCLAAGICLPGFFIPFKPYISAMFAVITFQGSLSNDFGNLRRTFLHPLPMISALAISQVFMPLLACALGHLFFTDTDLICGIVLEYSVPIAVTATMWVSLYNGDMSLTLGTVLISTCLAPLTIPATLQLLMGATVHVDAVDMIVDMLWMIVIPALLGTALNDQSYGRANKELSPVLAPLARILTILVITTNSTSLHDFILNLTPELMGVLALIAVLAASGYVWGFLMAKALHLKRDPSVSMTFCCAMKNISAGAIIAQAYFPSITLFPVMTGTLFSQFFAALFGKLFGTVFARMQVEEAKSDAASKVQGIEARYGKDIYVCQVAFGGETSAIRIDTFGSFHGIFVPMLSSKNNYTSLVPDTFDKEGYQAMGKAFNAYLKNFLETGNPNGEGLATWDAWDSERKESMVFDADDTDALIGMADVHTSYDDILAAMDADTTVPDALKKLVATNDMAGRWFSAANDAHYGAPDFWDIPYTD